MKSKILALVCLLFCLSFKGPTDLALLETFSRQFLQHRFSATIEASLYADYRGAKILDRQTYRLIAYGSWLNFKSKDFETIVNSKYALVVYPEMKKIILLDADQAKNTLPYGQFVHFLKNKEHVEDVSKEAVGESTGTCSFKIKYTPKEPLFKEVELAFDTSNLFPKQITLFYAQSLKELFPTPAFVQNTNATTKPRVELKYTRFNYLNSLDKKDFDFSPILYKNAKGKFSLSKAYSNFEFVNATKDAH